MSDAEKIAELERVLDECHRSAVAHRDRAERKRLRAAEALTDAARLRRAARALLNEVEHDPEREGWSPYPSAADLRAAVDWHRP